MLRTGFAYIYLTFVGVTFLLKYYFIKATKSQYYKEDTWWEQLGRKISWFLSKEGGLYVKFGQILSNASHIFPDTFTKHLKKLQDQSHPIPFKKMKKRFYEEWKKNPKDVFTWFQESPIASASIAQVYVANYKHKKVAVKVLYPGIEKKLLIDLKVIKNILKFLYTYIFPIPYEELYRQLFNLFVLETNLTLELKNIEKMRFLFLDDKDVYIPKPERELSTKGILVMEYIQGIPWNQIPKVKSHKENKSIYGEKFIQTILKMVFQFGYFHADPHPGNLFLLENGKLCFIDFGAMGEIPEEDILGFILLLKNILDKNPKGVLEAMLQLGILKKEDYHEGLIPTMELSIHKIHLLLSSLGSWKGQLLTPEDFEIFSLIRKDWGKISSRLQIPSSYVSLQRLSDIVIGNIYGLDPYHSFLEYLEQPFRGILLERKWFWL